MAVLITRPAALSSSVLCVLHIRFKDTTVKNDNNWPTFYGSFRGYFRSIQIPLLYKIFPLRQQVQTQLQGVIDARQFFIGDRTPAAQQARFFDGHDLLAFHIGIVGQAVFG